MDQIKTTQRMKLANSFKYLPKLEDRSVKLFIVDSPYFINYKSWDKSDLSFEDYFRQLVPLLVSKLADNGTIYFFMAKEKLMRNKNKNNPVGFIEILEDYGIVHIDNLCTWARQKGRGSTKKLKSTREEVVHFTKTKKFVWNDVQVLREVIAPYVKDGRPRGWFLNENGMRVRWTGLSDVWCYSSPQWNGRLDKQRHPAQKPFLLLERLILLSSNPGDLIVEPFMGGGMTYAVSKYHNRNYIGIEKDKTYFEDTKAFMKNHYADIVKYYEAEKLTL